MLNIDIVIFSLFLLVNLVVGLFHSRGVKNINQYALGDRNFSTATLTSTIVASWLGAEFFTACTAETYRQGLYFIIPSVGDCFAILFIGCFCAHRMGEFLGKLSIAEAMGDLFGVRVRFITVIFSIILSVGYLAIQFQITAKILESVFNTSGIYPTLISAGVIITYSAFGGIKSVTFTDVIQFFAFTCIIPVIAMLIFDVVSEHRDSFTQVATNPVFDYRVVLDVYNPRFYEMLSLGVLFLLPGFNPMTFQRISMAKNTSQIERSFKVSAFVGLCLLPIVWAIGVFILSDNPNLNPDDLLGYIVNRYTYVGFKGLFAVGIMAMIMSTADSLINSVSIIFAHDLCRPLGFQWAKNEVTISKIFAFFVGVSALLLALKFNRILDVILLSAGAYTSVVSIPFLFAVLGFRSSEKSVLAAMACGIIAFVIFEQKILDSVSIFGLNVVSAAPGILVNAMVLFLAHYLFNHPGGWVGIKDTNSFKQHLDKQKKQSSQFWSQVFRFDFLKFCANTPKADNMYHCVGLLSIVSILISMFSITKTVENSSALFFIFRSCLLFSTYFLICPILPNWLRHKVFNDVCWVIGLFYLLICVPTALLIMSNLVMMQSMLFMLHIILLLNLFRWDAGLLMIVLGFYSTTIMLDFLWSDASGVLDHKVQMIIGPSVLGISMLGSILIMFFRPMQQSYEQTGRLFFKAEQRLENMSKEMSKLISVRREFLDDITEEIRIPMDNIGSSAYAIYNNWDKYSDQERRRLAHMIYQEYENAIEYVNNIIDFSQVSNNKADLDLSLIDFASLAEKVIDKFKSTCLKKQKLEFSIINNLTNRQVMCDSNKIERVVTNLLKNACQYSDFSKLQLKFENVKYKGEEALKFSISDSGVGLLDDELVAIFSPFFRSSYTESKPKAHGLGLALCQKFIQLHGGIIWAQNNTDRDGSTFCFIIPVLNKTS